MAWQDELRRLDEELAAGHLSAEDYRAHRDQLLSAEASTAAPSQFRSALDAQFSMESTQLMPPVSGQPPEPDLSYAETTRIPRKRPPAADVTPDEDDADRTQVVDRSPPPQYSPPGAQPGYGGPPQFAGPAGGEQPDPGAQPPWHSWSETPPPWAAPDVQPYNQQALADSWTKQGPEVFTFSSSSSKRMWIISAVAVLVVALAGASVWYFGGFAKSSNGATNPPQTTPAAASPSTTQPPPPVIDLLPNPPGTVDPKNGAYSIEQARNSGLYDDDEFNELLNNDVEKVNFKASKNDKFEYTATVFETASQGSARGLTDLLTKQAERTGMQPGAKGQLPGPSIVKQYVEAGKRVEYRCIYAAGDKVVEIIVKQVPPPTAPTPQTDSEIIPVFQKYGASVAKSFPAG